MGDPQPRGVSSGTPNAPRRFLKSGFTNSVIALKISIISIPTALNWATEFRQPCAINAVRQLFGCRVQQASSMQNFTLSWMLSEGLKKNTFSCFQTPIQV